jgi:hypothetical protein
VERVPPAAPVVLADGGPRLQRGGGHAGDHEVEAGDVGGARERAVHRVAAAGFPHEGDVVGHLVPDRRRPRTGGLGGRRHHRQGLVVHGHPLGGVGGLLGRVRDDQRDGIADVADALAGQRRPRRGERRRAIATLASGVGGQVTQTVGGDVGSGEHGEHAGGPRRGRDIHRPDARVGVRRAHDDGVGLPRQAHVVRVAAEALEEAGILQAAHRLSDGELLGDQQLTHDGARVYARLKRAAWDGVG